MTDDDFDETDEFQRAMDTRPARIGRELAAAEDLARRLIAEGRDDDAVIVLEVIVGLQWDTVHLAGMHRSFVHRVAASNDKFNRRLEQMYEHLKGMAHVPEETFSKMLRSLRIFAHKTERGRGQRIEAARNRRPGTKHETKREMLPEFIEDYTKKHGVKDQQEWARRVMNGGSGVTLNALADSFRDFLTTKGLKPEYMPSNSSLRNWLREYLGAQ